MLLEDLPKVRQAQVHMTFLPLSLLPSPSCLPSAWNVDMMATTAAAIL